MRNFTLAYLKGWSGRTYNLGQNKLEQQTPIPPPPFKSRMKPREGQKRAILPSLFWGEGGQGFPFILSKIVAPLKKKQQFTLDKGKQLLRSVRNWIYAFPISFPFLGFYSPT